jgi:dipeptidyl aminopeptidase/acylaminoacyl peptidase
MRLQMFLLASLAFPQAAFAIPIPVPACEHILPARPTGEARRALAPGDLVRLRDIGPIDPEPWAAPFMTLSPDGKRAAFQLRQADPERNVYCLAMAIVDLKPGAEPRIVDEGGDLLMLSIDLRGAAHFPTGITSAITPRWSPDGRWIAFLKRTDGVTQLWRAMADGSGSAPLTHSAIDVVDFRIAPDGSSIAFATAAGLAKSEAAIGQEGLSGFHYDDRWSPFAQNEPFPQAPLKRAVKVLDLANGGIREANASEHAALASDSDLIATAGAPAHGPMEPGLKISATELTGGARAGAFRALLPNGGTAICRDAPCEGAMRPWWLPGKTRVRFFRREGWSNASSAIYEWNLSTGSVRRLYRTDDVLADCAPDGATLICLREGSLEPRRLERLDPATGKRVLLFDPNPEFSRLTLGRVRRLYWRNAFGLETLADLVLPVGYQSGKRYPLVVVQYDTRGFLRGGTGDEYPIQAFANRGFAVLSLRRPEAAGAAKGAKNFTEGRRLNLAGFADRKSAQSSLEGGIKLAIELGVADRARIGITGLSDGASTVTWALMHSSTFAAAAMSTCCIDTTLAMRVGPAAARDFEAVGYPGLLERNSTFWNDLSLSVSAKRISTPILLQLADDEYLDALESYTALKEAGAPVDMYVFPGEHHVKWQPAHRLAIYRRSLDWFDYWLKGVRSADPARKSELQQWDRLKGEHGFPVKP